MCNNIEDIIKQLTDIEKMNIGKILNNLEKDNQEAILECINDFTSPIALENENLTKVQTIFNAFNLFSIQDTKILIIGQDPYPDGDTERVKIYGERAQGLAFSFANRNGINEPADDSLLNIFKAIESYKHERNIDTKPVPVEEWNTNLEDWAKTNKVLLLNTALTYKEEENHFKIWNNFIKQIIKELIEKKPKNHKLAVFLWGQKARKIFYSAIQEKYPKSRQIKDYPNNIKIYITGHPTPSYNIVNRYGFSKDAHVHFAACDEFLFGTDESKYIWKNFPENN